jgi:hypothetical protein
MLVGVSQRGFIRRHTNSEMNQFAQRTGQPVADLAQGIRMRRLAQQHRYQLRRAREPFGSSFRLMFSHQCSELRTRKMP